MLGNDVDAFDSPNEGVEITLGAPNHVSDEIIDRLGTLVVNAEESREITILGIKRDDEWFQAGAGVRDSEVCGSCGLTDAADGFSSGLTV